MTISIFILFFFFNDTANTEIYTLSLHDALPIWVATPTLPAVLLPTRVATLASCSRSEEHTSELQSRGHLVCRLLLEKKKPYLPANILDSPLRPIHAGVVDQYVDAFFFF